MEKIKILLAAIGIFIFAFPIHASENYVWVDVEGVAYQSEIETPKEVRERAKKDAQNKGVEKAIGVFIRSHTLVSNGQLAEDLTYASVRGKIEKVEIVKEGWDESERDLYRIKLKALIKPVYPERGEGISLKVSLSKTVLKEGEEVKIFYQTNSACNIYIFSVAADGSVTLLLPNSIYLDNSAVGGKVYEFPPNDSKIKLEARFLPSYKKATAEERIKIIATRKKEDLIPLGFQEGFFKVYDAKSTGMISDLVKRLNQMEPTDWTEAQAVYVIKR